MKKVFVIGNSHAAALADVWDHDGEKGGLVEVSNSLFVTWRIPLICWGINIDALEKVFPSKLMDKDSTILFYVGSHDVRYNFVKYNNAKEVAENLYLVCKEYASRSGARFGFIDPVPVISDKTFFDESHGWWGYGSRDQILEQYNIFCNTLSELSDIKIKMQENIISSRLLLPEESLDGCHLNNQTNLKLIEEVKKFLYN